MSLMKSSVPLSVYRVDSSTLASITGERVRQFAFRSIDDIPDEKGHGFVNADDMFDLGWHTSVPEKGHYVTFGFRVDIRKIPSIILKKHLSEMLKEERERMTAQGKKFISKNRKSELKDLCKNRLLSKMEPRPSMSGVAIDMATGLVYVASTSKPVLEIFEQYFKTAFGGELERLSPGTLAASVSDHPVEDFMRDLYTESMSLSLNGKDYHIAEQGKATLSQSGGASVSVTDAPDSAKAGLESGLLFKSLKIRLSTMPDDELVSVFTLNSDFSFSGLKTPRIKHEKGSDDPDASFLLKMGFIEETVSAMHALFRQHCGEKK